VTAANAGDHDTSAVPSVLSNAFAPRYRLERELGSGGMATVYLARDLKHERDVAIKVFKGDVAAAVGAERFLDEIKTTAHLKHPHILPLFDSGSAEGTLFYVMPFIDGESLRDRLRREHRLPIGQIVRILRELADALAHAHAKGVIHRDVKPDNVLISDRHVFLADFGIARALAAHAEGNTITGTGIMIGTPVYMAPEQIVSGPVDHRTDIYGLGVLGYELLTGSPPFTASSHEVVAAKLTQSPEPVLRLRPEAPRPLADLIMRCLQKAPDQRWQRADDLLPVLDGLSGAETASMPVGKARSRALLAWAAPAVLVVGLIAAAWYAMTMTPASGSGSGALTVGRIARITSESGLELDPAIAPDGRTIAYAAGPIGRMRIYIRQIAGGRMTPLTDESFAEGQRWPQWSSDGARVAFQAGSQRLSQRSKSETASLYQTLALGGIPTRLFGALPGGLAIGPSWSPDNSDIVFGAANGLSLVSAGGDGAPRLLVAGTGLHSPRWSADRSKIAYVRGGETFTFGEEMLGNVSNGAIVVFLPGTGQTVRVTSGEWLDTNPLWMPDNQTLLFISTRGGGRDVYMLRLTPAGQPEGEPKRLTSGLNAHGISLSADARLLAYASYSPTANIWSVPILESGVASIADAQPVTFGNEKIEKLAISPDGKWLAYDSDRNGQADIWRVPLAGGAAEQVTRSPNHEFVNGWSPDGREIVFHSIREGSHRDVLVVTADGTRTEVVISTPAEEQHAMWGPDGNTIIFDSGESGESNRWNTFVVTRPHRGAAWGTPRQLTKSGSSDPKWSPDGRLIAFCALGQLRVINPDGTGERTLVDSRAAEDHPEPAYSVWSRDSQTIYYKAYDRYRLSTIWSVPVSGGPSRLLVRFDDPSRRSLRREFDTDGQRFYFTVARDESDLWSMELVRRSADLPRQKDP
jgi:Tol biopolymer transport system component